MPDSTPPAPPPAPPPPAGRDFATIYRATLSPLRRYLSRLLGNSAEAQDVAHDAYLRVFPSISQSSTEQPEALLYVTARRLAINRLKRRSISPIHSGPADFDTAASAAPSVEEQVMARQELTLLDVRTAEEFHGPDGHVPESQLIPLPELEARLQELPPGRPVVVVCHSGSRSALGTLQLQKAGLAQVANLHGGLRAWEAEGFPIEGAPASAS